MSKLVIENLLFERLVHRDGENAKEPSSKGKGKGKGKIVNVPMGWFAISHHFIEDKLARRLAHGRWYRISHKSLKTGEEYTVYRILRFAPQLSAGKDEALPEIAIDYVAWLDLDGRAERTDDSLELTIKEAAWSAVFRIVLSHPDPSFRLASILGIISIGLGALSVILALR